MSKYVPPLADVLKDCDTSTVGAAVGASLVAFYEDLRREMLAEIGDIERDLLGYGRPGAPPTTAQKCEWWRTRGQNCPVCNEGGK